MRRLSLFIMTAAVMSVATVSLPPAPTTTPVSAHQPIPESGTDPPTSTSSAPQSGVAASVATTAVTEHIQPNLVPRPNPVPDEAQIPKTSVLGTTPPSAAVVSAASVTPKSNPALEGTLSKAQPKAWVAVTTVVAAVGAYLGCPGPIVALIQKAFGSAWRWAVGIAMRESRCQPTAANPGSTARGIMQMEVPLHASEFTAVGCSWTQWMVAACNVAAAGVLYREVGTSPWRL